MISTSTPSAGFWLSNWAGYRCPGAEVISHGLRLRAEGGHDNRGRVRSRHRAISPEKREEIDDRTAQ